LRRYSEWSVMDTGWGQWIFEIFIEPAGVWFLGRVVQVDPVETA